MRVSEARRAIAASGFDEVKKFRRVIDKIYFKVKIITKIAKHNSATIKVNPFFPLFSLSIHLYMEVTRILPIIPPHNPMIIPKLNSLNAMYK